jgi:hypothetical protein
MATNTVLKQLEDAKRDLGSVEMGQNFNPIKSMSSLLTPYNEAKNLALYWLAKADPYRDRLDHNALIPLVSYVEQLVAIADGRGTRQTEAIPDAIRNRTAEFKHSLPMLIYGLLDVSGIAQLSDRDLASESKISLTKIREATHLAEDDIKLFTGAAQERIEEEVKTAQAKIQALRDKANEITVQGAKDQFETAAKALRRKVIAWGILAADLFVALLGVVFWFLLRPPPIIKAIVAALTPESKATAVPVSVPLLIAASAYYTSIRLAIIGIVALAFAFSLRMTRAYFHMIEHNHHKSRVTNSIEGFVASTATKEQRDMVLSKLVDCVTQFGDSGILDKDDEKASGLSAVILENITKNVGKQ